jgi:hypothetical protein
MGNAVVFTQKKLQDSQDGQDRQDKSPVPLRHCDIYPDYHGYPVTFFECIQQCYPFFYCETFQRSLTWEKREGGRS